MTCLTSLVGSHFFDIFDQKNVFFLRNDLLGVVHVLEDVGRDRVECVNVVESRSRCLFWLFSFLVWAP